MKGGPLGDICEKSLTKPKKIAQQIIGHGGTRTHVLLVVRPRKTVVTKWQWSSVTRFSVSAGLVLVPTYKIYKICQFVGLKKRSHYYSLRLSSKSAD